jgi:hypothetical membrane protein
MTRIGAWLWIATLQLFVAELITALAWPNAYSIANYTISDLGRVGCAEAALCSPLHAVFNVAIVVSGILTAVGGILLRHHWSRPRLGTAAVIAIALGGVCVALVGFFPVDAAPGPHTVVAFLQWLFQIAGMVLIAIAASGERAIRVVALVAVIVSATGFAAFLTDATPHGILERFAFDTLTWWQVITGALVLRSLRRRAAE